MTGDDSVLMNVMQKNLVARPVGVVSLLACLFLVAGHGVNSHSAEQNRQSAATTKESELSKLFSEIAARSELENAARLRSVTEGRLREFQGTTITQADIDALVGLRDRLTSLLVIDCTIDDSQLQAISTLHNLRELNLAYSHTTDDNLHTLRALTNLTSLWLVSTRVTDRGLSNLSAFPLLNTLGLDSTAITDKGLLTLGRIKTLTSLYIGSNSISDDGVTALGSLVSLENLRVNHNRRITSRSIAAIAGLSRISFLQIDSTSVDDKCVDDLLKMTNLTFLHAANTGITEDSLRRLRKELPRFERVP